MMNDFHELWKQVDLMDAPHQEFSIHFDDQQELELDIQLSSKSGIIIDLDEITSKRGLLFWKERQVILYIPGQNYKFHVSFCSTLESMQSKGRYHRYAVTTNTSGRFPIPPSNDVQLDVCRNCLRELNYQNYAIRNWNIKNQIVRNFKITAFFQQYKERFRSPLQ